MTTLPSASLMATPDHNDQRKRVVEIARSWLGTPYVNHARVKGAGVDCGQILVAVFHEAGLIPDFEVGYYPEQLHMHTDEERYIGMVKKFGREIDRSPLPGDVVVFKFGRCFSHGGIVTSWPTIIHAIRLAGCTIENVDRCIFGPRALANLPRKFFSYWGEKA